MIKKLVINSAYGGFSLSKKALMRLKELGHPLALEEEEEVHDDDDWFDGYLRNIPRNDELLIRVVKELGEEANGFAAELKIVKIPDDTDYKIYEYDGLEWVVYVDKDTCTLKEVW